MLFFSVILLYPHQKVGSHSPLFESGVAYDSLVTKRMQQKWLSMTFEARSEETMQLPPGSLGRLAQEDIQLPETIMLERPHTGTLPHIGTQLKQHSHFPQKGAQNVRKPSWKWVLWPQPQMSESPSHSGLPNWGPDIREQRLAPADMSCPNSWFKEPMIIKKWILFHATKRKVVCYTVVDNQKGAFGQKQKLKT